MEMDVSVQEQIMRHPLLGVTGSLNWLPGDFTLCVLLSAATTAAGHFQAQSPDLRNWLAQDVS